MRCALCPFPQAVFDEESERFQGVALQADCPIVLGSSSCRLRLFHCRNRSRQPRLGRSAVVDTGLEEVPQVVRVRSSGLHGSRTRPNPGQSAYCALCLGMYHDDCLRGTQGGRSLAPPGRPCALRHVSP